MSVQKVNSLLGFCRKAGRLVCGEEQSLKSIKSRKAKLVLIAADASDNTRKRVLDKCSFYSIPVVTYSTLDQLGAVTGVPVRAVVSVIDTGFAGGIKKALDADNPSGNEQ